ncbi:TetR family transcriptional regulator [Luteolibacter pohnpeiensis]|uniref:TetR family transcriptional regulator n=1 Tax=Luteolibacter pohnpeiensis TaxID=454153 RepID=A0A934VS66_9BACT|nr:TetR family transcriptional regulator [Luteolibacter pohnpeiensis]MBK1883956.1 TetR family transcriptional regulator [Luteolibacter pohnpeiensis]
MPEETPLHERILDTTEQVLRRYGPEKTNVVDVARALGMSHGNIYRHFPNKKALLDAVSARWMHCFTESLSTIASDSKVAPAIRLRRWFDTLRETKRKKIQDDPEFFQMYHTIAKELHDVVTAHVAELLQQLETIIRDGIKAGDFHAKPGASSAAMAFLQTTFAFHHPALLVTRVPSDDEADTVFDLLLSGMIAGPVSKKLRPKVKKS